VVEEHVLQMRENKHILVTVALVHQLGVPVVLLIQVAVLVAPVLQLVADPILSPLALDQVVQVEIDAVIRWILVVSSVVDKVVKLVMSVTYLQLLQLQQVFS